ncbi:MAG TPA: hypothetical protein VGT08_00435 [Terracidiphilus sp.]|nr:hypothetical protein [Terracidiphilus sp.]
MDGVVLVADDVDFVFCDYDYWLVLIHVSGVERLGLQCGVGGVFEIVNGVPPEPVVFG